MRYAKNIKVGRWNREGIYQRGAKQFRFVVCDGDAVYGRNSTVCAASFVYFHLFLTLVSLCSDIQSRIPAMPYIWNAMRNRKENDIVTNSYRNSSLLRYFFKQQLLEKFLHYPDVLIQTQIIRLKSSFFI